MIRRMVGVLLVLPLPVAIAWSYVATSGCQDECHGDIVYAGICLLLTAPAAVGALLLAGSSRAGALTTLVAWLVGLVAIVFAVGAVAALLEGLRTGRLVYVGFGLFATSLLIPTLAALRAAQRRRGPPGSRPNG